MDNTILYLSKDNYRTYDEARNFAKVFVKEQLERLAKQYHMSVFIAKQTAFNINPEGILDKVIRYENNTWTIRELLKEI